MLTGLVIAALVILFSIAIIALCVAFFVLQVVLERFLEVTLPILALAYGKIRYPRDFKDNQ